MIADTGGKVSIATAIEMQMRHGMPPIQQALDHGITPSLSVDVETQHGRRHVHGDARRPSRCSARCSTSACWPANRTSRRFSPAARSSRWRRFRARATPTSTARSARSRRARRPTSSCCGRTDQRDAAKQRAGRRRDADGHEQRRHRVHRREADEARRAACRRRSRAIRRTVEASREAVLTRAGYKGNRLGS